MISRSGISPLKHCGDACVPALIRPLAAGNGDGGESTRPKHAIMTGIPRRTVLQRIAATAICSPAAVRSHPAAAALPPLPNLPASDALLLRPGDAQFVQYEPAFNARTMLTPQLRAMCKTPNAVGVVVDWCRSNNMPFAVRCGGLPTR